MAKKDPRLTRAGVTGFNKPKRTPNHPKKSHIVVAKQGDKIKTIRFGQQGASTAGAPKKGESQATKNRRKSFKARHAKNIAKGKMSAAFWSDKIKWSWNEKPEQKRKKQSLVLMRLETTLSLPCERIFLTRSKQGTRAAAEDNGRQEKHKCSQSNIKRKVEAIETNAI